MTSSLDQQALSAGEISPELYGEVSLAKYGSALTTGRNAVINYKGGAFSRGGLALVGVCLQTRLLELGTSTGAPRPIPFQFSITQGYVLEFGDNYLRFVFQGGYVLENPIAISGATNANPAQISVTGTPFANGDWVFASGVGGMTQLNGNTYIVAGAASGHFTLQDLNGNPVNSTAFGGYTSGGTFSRLYTISTPYAAVDLPYLKFAQSADVMSLTLSNPITGTEYPPYDLTRLSAIDWTLIETDFDPVIVPPATISASANAKAPSSGINATFAYQVTAVDVKGNESVASATATCNGADIEVEGGTNTITWSFVSGSKFYNVYRAPPAVNNKSVTYPVPAGSIFGFVGSSYGTQFLDTQSVADLTQTPPTHQDPFAPGQILSVDITSGGNGLTTVSYTLGTVHGTDFAGFPVVNGGSLGAFPITNPGRDFAPGDTISFNGVGFASGAITFATNPSAGDTITLNGVVWTFVTAITGADQTLIQGALSDTLNSLVSDLSASSNPSLTVASYAEDSGGTILGITYNTPGTGGNAYTLAASAATPSGGTLTGGSGAIGAQATGTYTFTLNPTNGQTIVLDGVTWTFVTSGASGTQTNIQVDLATTLTQLVANLTASGNTNIQKANYTVSTTVLTITYKTTGVIGNGYTLAAGSYGGTVSGPTLTGGINGPGAPSATLNVGPVTGTYPGVNTYFQQRRFYANSFNDPDTFWASQTGLFQNFDTSIPSSPTDSITASPWTEQVNGIQWLVPMPGGLIAMTGRRAWQIVGEGSYALNTQPITPSSTQAQPQAFNGCSATIPPIVIDYDVIYAEAIGNTTVRDLSWNFFSNIYTGADLTLLSSHLFLYQQIVQWAWARKPYKVLWGTRDDGTMLSLTYLKEQEVYGWARHDTLGLFVGVASITEPPVDAIYTICQRFPPYSTVGIYTMERMDDRIWQSVEDAYAVDSGVSNPMTVPETFVYAGAPSGLNVRFTAGKSVFDPTTVGKIIRMGGGIARLTFYQDSENIFGDWILAASDGAIGLPYSSAGNWSLSSEVTSLNAPHLAGMSGLVALADGVPVTGLSASATGLITLPFAASDAKAGLPFAVQLQTPYLNGRDVVQGARKVIPAVTVRLAGSGGFQYGTNQPDGAAQNPPQLAPAWSNLATGDTTKPTGGQSSALTYISPGGQPVTQLWTGDLRVIGEGAEWNSKGQVAIQQTLPLALEITSIAPEVLPGDLPEVSYSPQQGRQDMPQAPRGPGLWAIKGPRI